MNIRELIERLEGIERYEWSVHVMLAYDDEGNRFAALDGLSVEEDENTGDLVVVLWPM